MSNRFFTKHSDSGTGILFECTKCGACCRHENLIVTVTGRDLAKLSRSLGLSSKELLRAIDFYVPRENELSPNGLRNIPAVMTERGLAYIALKKLEGGDCIFLKDNLCMIHSFRPSVCKSFPFVFEKRDDYISWGMSAIKDICPGIGSGSEVCEGELEELGISIIEDLEIFSEFVEEWNHTKESKTALLLLDTILKDSRFFV